MHVVTAELDINLPLLLQQDIMNEEALAAAAEREENMQRNGPCEFVIGFVLVRAVFLSLHRRRHHHTAATTSSSTITITANVTFSHHVSSSGNVFWRYLLNFFDGFQSVVQAGDV